MSERAEVFEITQIGPESTRGTAVPATRRLIGTSIRPSIQTEVQTYRAKGVRVGSVGVLNKEWVEADIEQDPALYSGETTYLIGGLLGPPSISNPSSGVYLGEWDPLTFTGLNPKTYTVESGSWIRAGEFPYGLVTGLEMTGTRDGVSLSGSMIGQEYSDNITLTAGTAEVQTLTASGTVSGGTYTLQFMGETTSSLAYNANTATIQAALDALVNVASGDITVGGGTLPGTPATFTFGGQYASADVPLIVVNGASLTGSTPAYTMTQTTAGAALTEIAIQPISGKDWDFYIDDTGAGVGTTKLTRVFEWSWGITGMYGPVWPGNTSEPSWAAHVDLAPDTSFSFTVEADSTGMAELADLRAGTKRFVRIKCTGPTLGASTYLMQFDFCVHLTGISEFKDQDGVYAVTYEGEIQYDKTWGKWISWDLRNETASIA